jgi:hypothetical protein
MQGRCKSSAAKAQYVSASAFFSRRHEHLASTCYRTKSVIFLTFRASEFYPKKRLTPDLTIVRSGVMENALRDADSPILPDYLEFAKDLYPLFRAS